MADEISRNIRVLMETFYDVGYEVKHTVTLAIFCR